MVADTSRRAIVDYTEDLDMVSNDSTVPHINNISFDSFRSALQRHFHKQFINHNIVWPVREAV